MKSVLVVADALTKIQHALDHAVNLAKKTGVNIMVASFSHETLAMLSPSEEEAREIQQKLDEFDIAGEHIHICEGDPGKEISSLAGNLAVECVVIMAGCSGRLPVVTIR